MLVGVTSINAHKSSVIQAMYSSGFYQLTALLCVHCVLLLVQCNVFFCLHYRLWFVDFFVHMLCLGIDTG